MTNPGTTGDQLSHELRTPLNAILGNVELLLDGTIGPLSSEARACVGEIQAAGHRLARQVQTLLLWSEVRASAPLLSREPLDLVALIRQIVAGDRPHACQIRPCEASLVVHGDRAWLTTMMVEVIALGGGAAAGPAVTLDAGEDHAALGFSWPGFCPDQAVSLQIALIEAIADLHGCTARLITGGLCLYWPATRPAEVDGTGAPPARVPPSGSVQDCAKARD